MLLRGCKLGLCLFVLLISSCDINNLDSGIEGGTGSSTNDIDQDGTSDDKDNCPNIKNEDQENLDNDNFGNACDLDRDNDSVIDEVDNCPLVSNFDQLDVDNDGVGDVCDQNIVTDSVSIVSDCELLSGESASFNKCAELGLQNCRVFSVKDADDPELGQVVNIFRSKLDNGSYEFCFYDSEQSQSTPGDNDCWVSTLDSDWDNPRDEDICNSTVLSRFCKNNRPGETKILSLDNNEELSSDLPVDGWWKINRDPSVAYQSCKQINSSNEEQTYLTNQIPECVVLDETSNCKAGKMQVCKSILQEGGERCEVRECTNSCTQDSSTSWASYNKTDFPNCPVEGTEQVCSGDQQSLRYCVAQREQNEDGNASRVLVKSLRCTKENQNFSCPSDRFTFKVITEQWIDLEASRCPASDSGTGSSSGAGSSSSSGSGSSTSSSSGSSSGSGSSTSSSSGSSSGGSSGAGSSSGSTGDNCESTEEENLLGIGCEYVEPPVKLSDTNPSIQTSTLELVGTAQNTDKPIVVRMMVRNVLGELIDRSDLDVELRSSKKLATVLPNSVIYIGNGEYRFLLDAKLASQPITVAGFISGSKLSSEPLTFTALPGRMSFEKSYISVGLNPPIGQSVSPLLLDPTPGVDILEIKAGDTSAPLDFNPMDADGNPTSFPAGISVDPASIIIYGGTSTGELVPCGLAQTCFRALKPGTPVKFKALAGEVIVESNNELMVVPGPISGLSFVSTHTRSVHAGQSYSGGGANAEVNAEVDWKTQTGEVVRFFISGRDELGNLLDRGGESSKIQIITETYDHVDDDSFGNQVWEWRPHSFRGMSEIHDLGNGSYGVDFRPHASDFPTRRETPHLSQQKNVRVYLGITLPSGETVNSNTISINVNSEHHPLGFLSERTQTKQQFFESVYFKSEFLHEKSSFNNSNVDYEGQAPSTFTHKGKLSRFIRSGNQEYPWTFTGNISELGTAPCRQNDNTYTFDSSASKIATISENRLRRVSTRCGDSTVVNDYTFNSYSPNTSSYANLGYPGAELSEYRYSCKCTTYHCTIKDYAEYDSFNHFAPDDPPRSGHAESVLEIDLLHGLDKRWCQLQPMPIFSRGLPRCGADPEFRVPEDIVAGSLQEEVQHKNDFFVQVKVKTESAVNACENSDYTIPVRARIQFFIGSGSLADLDIELHPMNYTTSVSSFPNYQLYGAKVTFDELFLTPEIRSKVLFATAPIRRLVKVYIDDVRPSHFSVIASDEDSNMHQTIYDISADSRDILPNVSVENSGALVSPIIDPDAWDADANPNDLVITKPSLTGLEPEVFLDKPRVVREGIYLGVTFNASDPRSLDQIRQSSPRFQIRVSTSRGSITSYLENPQSNGERFLTYEAMITRDSIDANFEETFARVEVLDPELAAQIPPFNVDLDTEALRPERIPGQCNVNGGCCSKTVNEPGFFNSNPTVAYWAGYARGFMTAFVEGTSNEAVCHNIGTALRGVRQGAVDLRNAAVYCGKAVFVDGEEREEVAEFARIAGQKIYDSFSNCADMAEARADQLNISNALRGAFIKKEITVCMSAKAGGLAVGVLENTYDELKIAWQDPDRMNELLGRTYFDVVMGAVTGAAFLKKGKKLADSTEIFSLDDLPVDPFGAAGVHKVLYTSPDYPGEVIKLDKMFTLASTMTPSEMAQKASLLAQRTKARLRQQDLLLEMKEDGMVLRGESLNVAVTRVKVCEKTGQIIEFQEKVNGVTLKRANELYTEQFNAGNVSAEEATHWRNLNNKIHDLRNAHNRNSPMMRRLGEDFESTWSDPAIRNNHYPIPDDPENYFVGFDMNEANVMFKMGDANGPSWGADSGRFPWSIGEIDSTDFSKVYMIDL